jgi:hypothetical protein
MDHKNNNRYNIYENSSDNKYRYALGTKGKKTLFCFGINPSTATSEETDTTITKVENIAYKKGKAKNVIFKEMFDSFVMLNIYPLRATNPEDLPLKMENVIKSPEHLKNVECILKLIKDESVVWAAWGNLLNSRSWLDDCLKDILLKVKKMKKGIRWVKMGDLTAENEPQHPSRVKYQEFSKYTIKYIEN